MHTCIHINIHTYILIYIHSDRVSRLQGYGVFLDIKNMEYKNVDDEADKKKDSDALSDEEVRDSVYCMYVCMFGVALF